MMNELTNTLFDKIIKKLNTPENIKKVQLSLIDPLIGYTSFLIPVFLKQF